MTASPADGAPDAPDDDDDDALASVLSRYPKQPGVRWVNVTMAVLLLTAGMVQVIRAHVWPYYLVVGAMWAAFAASGWVFFAADIRRDGIKLQRRAFLPWSEVVDVVIPQGRWKGSPVELLLVDGSTAALPQLTRQKAAALHRFLSGARA